MRNSLPNHYKTYLEYFRIISEPCLNRTTRPPQQIDALDDVRSKHARQRLAQRGGGKEVVGKRGGREVIPPSADVAVHHRKKFRGALHLQVMSLIQTKCYKDTTQGCCAGISWRGGTVHTSFPGVAAPCRSHFMAWRHCAPLHKTSVAAT